MILTYREKSKAEILFKTDSREKRRMKTIIVLSLMFVIIMCVFPIPASSSDKQELTNLLLKYPAWILQDEDTFQINVFENEREKAYWRYTKHLKSEEIFSSEYESTDNGNFNVIKERGSLYLFLILPGYMVGILIDSFDDDIIRFGDGVEWRPLLDFGNIEFEKTL